MANTALPWSSLAVTSDAFRYYRVMPINDIEGKSHKTELKSRCNYYTNRL